MKQGYQNATIVDVRSPAEFSSEHISSAINIPLEQIPNRLDEFKKMPRPILAYCRSGGRSGVAVNFLKKNGIEEAINAGGLEEIKQALRK